MASQQPYISHYGTGGHPELVEQQLCCIPHPDPQSTSRSSCDRPNNMPVVVSDVDAWASQEISQRNNYLPIEIERDASGFSQPRTQTFDGFNQQGVYESPRAPYCLMNWSITSGIGPSELCQRNIANGLHRPEPCVDPHCLTLQHPQAASIVSHQCHATHVQSPMSNAIVGPNPSTDPPSPYASAFHNPPIVPPQPVESDLRSSLRSSQQRGRSQHQIMQTLITSQYHDHGLGNQHRPISFTTSNDPRDDYVDCSTDCCLPCETESDVCDKPYKCTSPPSECLELCDGPSDQCGKRSRCESEQCEVLNGFCDAPILDQTCGPTGSYHGGPFRNDQSYGYLSLHGEPQLSFDEVPLTNSQRHGSMTSIPALSPDDNESIDYSGSPEESPFAVDATTTSPFDPLDISHLHTASDRTFGSGLQATSYQLPGARQEPDSLLLKLSSTPCKPHEGLLKGMDLDANTMKTEGQEALSGEQMARIPSNPDQGDSSATLRPQDNIQRQCKWSTDHGICGMWFQGNDLNQHWINDHKNEGMRCKWSGCKSPHDGPKSDKLARHMVQHTGYIYGYCGVCSKSCNNRDNLKQHERTHSDKAKRVTCDICHTTLATEAGLRDHWEAKHSGVQRFQCDYCSHRCNNAQNNRKHMESKCNLALYGSNRMWLIPISDA